MIADLPDILARRAELSPDSIAIEEDGSGRCLDYAELDDRAGRAAALLRAAGVDSGDRVAIICRNRIAFFEREVAATRSGISDSHGLVFTGTPKSAGFDKRVSISVDLSISGAENTTLVFTPTGVMTGPGTADQEVPEDRRAAVLHAFRASLPDQRLPFGVAPTSQGARGSDVIIEGITKGLTVSVAEFRQS